MKRASFLVSTFLFLLLPAFASAEIIVVNSPIASDTTWTAGNVYVIDSSFQVLVGATLTIEPGTIVKGKTSGMSLPTIYGRLVAQGTSEAPIYFACFWDDSIGGDTDGYPDTSCQGDWQGLYFKPGSTGIFEHIRLTGAGYGGYGYGNYVGIENDGGEVTIKNANIFDNFRYVNIWGFGGQKTGIGVANKNGGRLRIENSVIDNGSWGVYDNGGALTELLNNTIKNNADPTGINPGYGVYAEGPGSLILKNNTFIANTRTATIEGAKDFVSEGNTSEDLSIRGLVIFGRIRNGAVLKSGDLPLVVDGAISNNAGDSFSIASGTIIKMKNAGIAIYGGELKILGTKESPVIITSLADDSVGGDTNNDGDATSPNTQLTKGIQIDADSKVKIEHLKIKYAGALQGLGNTISRASIFNHQGELEIKHSEISDNDLGIFGKNASTSVYQVVFDRMGIPLHLDGGQMTVRESSFKGNHQIQNYGTTTLDAKHNWWSSPAGPYHEVLNPTGNTSSSIQARVDFIPWLAAEPGTEPEHSVNPVIVIPGIMGSAYSPLLNRLVIDPILHTYDNLIDTLEINGYIENKSLFTFPYEWRDSNVTNANLLKNKIDEVKQLCTEAVMADIDCNKVDVVAHSMGGLVAREYIQSGQYQNDIDQIIFLGVPHKGSPKAYNIWEAGEFPPGTIDSLIKLKFSIEATKNFYPSLFDYIRNRPIASVQELLPIFDYIKDKDTGVLRNYPNNYPRNIFLESLNINTHKLLNSGVRITNIIGDSGNNTIEKIRVVPTSDSKKWIYGEPEGFNNPNSLDRGLETGAGDSTVTILGATLDASIENKVENATHLQLPTKAEGEIIKILTGQDSVENINHGLIRNMLTIQLRSPIDMVVTAPDGKKLGKDFITGQIYNEIPLAFYSGYQTDDEFITIPNPIDGEYKIELQGVDQGGEYGVSTSYVSDDQLATKEVFGLATPGQITNVSVKFDNSNPENLSPEREITPEILIEDINKSYDLGWIKDKKTRDALLKQVNGAIKFNKKIEKIKERLPDGSVKEKKIQKFSVKINKILVKILEKELESLRKKDKITEEAYTLISNDIRYLNK